MKKLLQIAASLALLGGVLLVTPQTAAAARKYSAWVSINGTSLSSTGSCTSPNYYHLQDALDDASDGWTIYVCPGTYRASDDENDYFEIYDDVTIVGAGRNRTLIDGECNGYGTIQSGDSTGYALDLTLKNLSMINGCQDERGYGDGDYNFIGGGAVMMSEYGDFNCVNVAFSNNYAHTSGGAVYADEINLDKCLFENNNADWGGAVYSYGTVHDNGSTFNANVAWVDGGAVALFDGGTFINSIFTGNKASEGVELGRGGAIFAYQYYGSDLVVKGGTYAGNLSFFGGALYGYDYTDESAVRTNKVIFRGNSACTGGAIDSDGSVYDTQSLFTLNETWDGCGVGGGIYVDDKISLSGTTFKANQSLYDSEAFFLVSCSADPLATGEIVLKKVKFDRNQYQGYNWDGDC